MNTILIILFVCWIGWCIFCLVQFYKGTDKKVFWTSIGIVIVAAFVTGYVWQLV